jgi:hypothetical protein
MMDFKDLLKKKAKCSNMSDKECEAKMEVLNDLKGLMQDKMGEDLKKVTVASDSKEGLEEGLELASEAVEGEEESKDEEYASKYGSDDESEEMDYSNMSEEELDEMIAKLEKLKSEKSFEDSDEEMLS